MNKLKQQEKTMLEKAPALLTLTVGSRARSVTTLLTLAVSAREDLISITKYSHKVNKTSYFNHSIL